ncbi:MAG: hypothetical protein AAF914_02715 [Pseudomonadota bacterium]
MKYLIAPVVALGVGVTASTAAWARCPVSLADAANGVYVDFGDFVVRYDRRDDGRVEELEFDTQEGTGYRYISQHGIFLVESQEMAFGYAGTGTFETITYDTPPPPRIEPNLTYSTNITVRFGTEQPFREPLSIVVGPEQSQLIGACRLQTLSVNMRQGPPGNEFISQFMYFVDLGMAIYIGGGTPEESPSFGPPISIDTDPPMRPLPGGPSPQQPGK